MKEGKHSRKKFKIFEVYSVLIFIVTLFISIGYAEISDVLLNITGTVQATAQEGVFIANISNISEETTNSKINYFIGTMLESQIVLGDTADSSITYEVTLYNNSDKEYIYIGTITDTTDGILYDNENIEFFETGIEQYKTTIAPTQSLKFTITFKYKDGTQITNNTLNSKLNFRFKEIPKLVLSNEGQTYTLNDIYPDYTAQEYEFSVSNFYSDTEINRVPMTYYFTTTIDSPLTAKIYDESGNEVTAGISIDGDGQMQTTHTYTLKIIWDNSNITENIAYNSIDYANKQFKCNIILKAVPNDNKYMEYAIQKQFNVDIETDTFYLEASTNSAEVEFNGKEAQINLEIKNNNGTNYNIYDTQYEISLENNENFIFSTDNVDLVNDKIIKTIKGNSLLSENLKISLIAKENATISLVENITLKIKSTSVYEKEISIPITIKLVPGNIEVSIDTTTGTFANSSSTTNHKITVVNNNSIPITYKVSGNSTSELILSGADQEIVVAANSQSTTTITLSPVQNYVYLNNSSAIDISVNIVAPYELNSANYTININTYASKMRDIILAKYTINETTPDFTENITTTTNSGVFKATDSGGTAYYFRGVISNNYVSFAGKTWRIMRINSDGTMRLLLNSPIDSSTTYSYTTSSTNTVYNNSVVKSTLENWYSSNLASYNSYINQNTLFIYDRRASSASASVYKGWERLYNASPTINISGIDTTYLYSKSGNTSGNGYLTYPIGLATSDELMMAGAVITTGSTSTTVNGSNLNPNYNFYVANDVPAGVGLWLMTPFSPTAVMCYKTQVGFYKETPTSARLLKPVIELNASNEYKGNGTETNPYVIY